MNSNSSANFDDDTDEAELEFEDEDDMTAISGASVFAISLLKLGVFALRSPFDVAKIMLQLQHIPRPLVHEDRSLKSSAKIPMPPQDFGAKDDEDSFDLSDEETVSLSSDDSDDFSGSSDAERRSFKRRDSPARRDYVLECDSNGYVKPERLARPRFQVPPLRGGIWNTISRISSFKAEGIVSLWKGLVPSLLFELPQSILQPALEDAMNEQFGLYDPQVVPLFHQQDFIANLSTQVASKTLVAFLFSPLEVLQTIMVVQSADPLFSSFRSTWHAFYQTMLRPPSVGSFETFSRMYPTPFLTLTHHFLSSLFNSCGQLIMRRIFGISPVSSPLKYGICWFAMETLFLCVILPVETIRRRLMVRQIRRHRTKVASLTVDESINPVKFSCVRLVDRGYTSVFDCFYRIVTEESLGTSTKSSAVWKLLMNSGFGGIVQLYRGFWFQSSLNATYCMLKILSGLEITGDEDHYYF